MAAKHAIRRGDPITPDDLDFMSVAGVLPATAQTSLQAVVGKVAVSDIAAGQFVLSGQVSTDRGQAGLALLVPAGFRAIAFRTNDEIAVGNLIRPGDHVDIELVLPEAVLPSGSDATRRADGSGTEVHTLLQDVIVLAVGQQLSTTPAADADASTGRPAVEQPVGLTMAMTPDQVSQFVLGRSIGTLFLALRNPGDPQTVTQDLAALRDIRGTLAGAMNSIDSKRPIELVTGSKSRTIYSISSGAGR